MFQILLASRYLLGRKSRTVLTTLAVAFAVTIIFGLNGMLPVMMENFRENLMTASFKVDLEVTQVTSGTFNASTLETVQNVPGIMDATGALRRTVIIPDTKVATITVAGIDPPSAVHVHSYPIQEGRMLEGGDMEAILITDNLAHQLNLGLGGSLALPSTSGSTDFTIVGILTSRPIPGSEEVTIPLQAAQELFGQPGQINSIEAIYTPNADAATVQAAVQAAVGDTFHLGALAAGTDLIASLQVGLVAINLFGVMALVMGGFIIFNTFRTIVAERRRDIGMLRAVGASRRMIIGVVLAESTLQGVVGTLIGMAGGGLLVVMATRLIGGFMAELLHFRIDTVTIAPWVYVLSIVLGVGVTLVSGLYPALAASRITPLEAMRPQAGEAFQSTARRGALAGAILIGLALTGLFIGEPKVLALSAVVFIIGLVLAAPFLIHPLAKALGGLLTVVFAREGHLAQGNLARQPARAAITASTVMIGLAVLLALAGVASSLFAAFLGYLDTSLGADYIFMPQSMVLTGGNVGAGPQLQDEIRHTPGVKAVTSLRVGISQTAGATVQMVGIDPQVYPQVVGLEFIQGDDISAYQELAHGRTLFVNGILAAQHNIKVGDRLTLATASGSQEYKVVAIGLDYLNAKLSTAYISQANLERDFHVTEDLLLLVQQQPAADGATVRGALQDLAASYPAFNVISWQEFHQSQEQIFKLAMYFFYILMIALTAPSLIALVNTLVINVLERTREIGMLRAVGSTRKQVQRMVLAESLLLAAVGTGFGILAGLWLGYALVGGMNLAGFPTPYHFPAAGILVTIAVGLLFGGLASIIPARKAAGLEIVKALRYE